MNLRTAKTRREKRRGASVVEVAICLPILLTFIFVGVEFSRANMLRNSIENAAYEGARRGIVPGATSADCDAAAQAMLDILGVAQANITVDPPTLTPTTDTVTVTVGVDMTAANCYFTPKFFLGKTLVASVALPREVD